MSTSTKETLATALRALAVIVVNVAALCGVALDADMVIEVLCAVVMIVVTAYGCWKNFNFTAAARAGQQLTNLIKAKVEDDPEQSFTVAFDIEEVDEDD